MVANPSPHPKNNRFWLVESDDDIIETENFLIGYSENAGERLFFSWLIFLSPLSNSNISFHWVLTIIGLTNTTDRLLRCSHEVGWRLCTRSTKCRFLYRSGVLRMLEDQKFSKRPNQLFPGDERTNYTFGYKNHSFILGFFLSYWSQAEEISWFSWVDTEK